MRRRLLGFALALCMALSMLPSFAIADETAPADNAVSVLGMGLTAARDNQELSFAGNQWLILDADTATDGSNGIAVIAKDVVGEIAYNETGFSGTWESSNAKTWVSDYTDKTFNEAALSYIKTIKKSADTGVYFGSNWGGDALNNEKVFFLSAAEVYQIFGANAIDGMAVEKQGGWLLRSVCTDSDILVGGVSDVGFVGTPHAAANWGARPAFNIDGTKVVMTSANTADAKTANGLTAIADAAVSSWKLTLLDETRSFQATAKNATENQLNYTDWKVSVEFSGAAAGENEYVSAAITDQMGKTVYYGHIATNTASGTVDVAIPQGLSGLYTLHIFSEQCNGVNKNDFASADVEIPLTVKDSMGSKVDNWGLTLEGNIHASFNVTADNAGSLADATIKATVNEKTVTAKVTENASISVDVAAAEMMDTITVQVISDDGTPGAEYKYSVYKYGQYILSDTSGQYSSEQKEMVRTMLNYGGKAQEYFGYNTGSKADKNISVTETAPPSEVSDIGDARASDQIVYYGATLNAKSKVGVRFYFKLKAGVTAQDVGITVDGSNAVLRLAFDDVYYVDANNIMPQDYRKSITVKSGEMEIQYSPFHYISRMYHSATSTDRLKDLCRAMYTYHIAAQQMSSGENS